MASSTKSAYSPLLLWSQEKLDEERMKLLSSSHAEFLKFLQDDLIGVNEYDLFQAVVRWARNRISGTTTTPTVEEMKKLIAPEGQKDLMGLIRIGLFNRAEWDNLWSSKHSREVGLLPVKVFYCKADFEDMFDATDEDEREKIRNLPHMKDFDFRPRETSAVMRNRVAGETNDASSVSEDRQQQSSFSSESERVLDGNYEEDLTKEFLTGLEDRRPGNLLTPNAPECQLEGRPGKKRSLSCLEMTSCFSIFIQPQDDPDLCSVQGNKRGRLVESEKSEEFENMPSLSLAVRKSPIALPGPQMFPNKPQTSHSVTGPQASTSVPYDNQKQRKVKRPYQLLSKRKNSIFKSSRQIGQKVGVKKPSSLQNDKEEVLKNQLYRKILSDYVMKMAYLSAEIVTHSTSINEREDDSVALQKSIIAKIKIALDGQEELPPMDMSLEILQEYKWLSKPSYHMANAMWRRLHNISKPIKNHTKCEFCSTEGTRSHMNNNHINPLHIHHLNVSCELCQKCFYTELQLTLHLCSH